MGTPFRAQVISLSALPASSSEADSNLLCPVRALRNYVTRSAVFRRSEQLFVSFGGRTKGLAASKHSLSRWIVDAIAAAYASKNLQCPLGIQAHSTRGMASSWAWSSGISIHDICTAAEEARGKEARKRYRRSRNQGYNPSVYWLQRAPSDEAVLVRSLRKEPQWRMRLTMECQEEL
ncbi:hypothetical protein PO909_011313 [Leuciscus waleckii]